MSAQDLLTLGSPALLALVGQTRIDQPEVVFPEVLSQLHRVPEVERRSRLITALLALIEDEEIEAMVERLFESDELLMDTPFLRRIRAEGREEGRQEGQLIHQRQVILQALNLRFDVQDDQLAAALEQISDAVRLETLFAAAIQCADLDAFRAVLTSDESAE